MKYSCVTAERNVMYFSVTRENCSTSPVSSSVFGRIDLTKPPNSAPRTSSGTPPWLSESMAMPSRPIRLTASVPSTRSRMPESTCLNSANVSPPYFRQPAFEPRNLRRLRRDEERLRFRLRNRLRLGFEHRLGLVEHRLRLRFRRCHGQRIELRANGVVVRIAREDVF